MAIKGGYKLIDLKDSKLTVGEGVTVKGIYNSIKNSYNKYRLTEKSIEYYDGLNQQWNICPYRIIDLLNGDDEIIKKPILDDIERKYLSNVIKPFRDKVTSVIKYESGIYEYIVIRYRSIEEHIGTVHFPPFKKGTMYKGMEVDKEYNLEDLRL